MNDAELEKEWTATFPKLAELRTELQGTAAYEGWFASLPQKSRLSPLSRDWHKALESELAALSAQVWSELKAKIVKQVRSNLRELASLLSEASGYSCLKSMLSARSIAYDTICQPAVRGTKARKPKEPEWVALLGGQVVAAIEVKTVFESEAYFDAIESTTQKLLTGKPLPIQRLVPEAPDRLLKKLTAVVGNAKKQLRAVEGQPPLLLVYVIVNVDFNVAQWLDCKTAIERHLDQMNEPDILVIGQLHGLWS
jgi:hypothetical protein